MSRRKASATELNNRKTQAMMDYGIAKEGIEIKDLAKRIGKDPRTIYNKRNSPETMTLREIRIFIKVFKLTNEQIIEFLGIG